LVGKGITHAWVVLIGSGVELLDMMKVV